jgi:hypothetical protein
MAPAHPFPGPSRLSRASDWPNDIAFAWPVAVEAGLIGRHIGMAGNFDETVAITTVQSELTGVNLVRKGHRLGRLISDTGVLRREIVGDPHRNARSDESERDGQFQRKPVGPARKEVAHKQSVKVGL